MLKCPPRRSLNIIAKGVKISRASMIKMMRGLRPLEARATKFQRMWVDKPSSGNSAASQKGVPRLSFLLDSKTKMPMPTNADQSTCMKGMLIHRERMSSAT